jgi:DNA-binding transcriptional LysR family regulator
LLILFASFTDSDYKNSNALERAPKSTHDRAPEASVGGAWEIVEPRGAEAHTGRRGDRAAPERAPRSTASRAWEIRWWAMELRQLKYFIAVAERLSFSRAAEELHVTVPPLSRQIRQLEDEFGVPLFVRDRRHVALTDAGRTLLQEANVLVAQSAHVSDCVRRAKRGEAGLVKMGIAPGLGERVSRVLLEHSKQYPAVDLQYREMFSGEQSQTLLDGDIDVAFVRSAIDAVQLSSEVLFEERFVVHVSKQSPLAKRRSLRMKDIAAETLLLPNRQCCEAMYDKTLELYAEAGISPNVLHVPLSPAPNSDAQTLMVACRKGIFIIPDEAARRPHPGGDVTAIPLDEPSAKIDVCVAWRRNENSSAVLTFLDSVRRVLRSRRGEYTLAAGA